MKRKTHEQFIKEVEAIVGDEFTIIGKYIGAQMKIKIKHNICDHEWDIQPANILNRIKKGRCPKCSGSTIRKTQEAFIADIYRVHKEGITLTDEYKNNRTKVKVKNNICEHEYFVLPTVLLKGSSCMECSGNKKKTHEDFLVEVKEKYEDSVTVLGTYVNVKTKVKIINNDCGHSYSITSASLFHKNYRCRLCYHANRRKTTDEFKKELYKMIGDEFSLVGEYTTSTDKITIKHEACGYEYEVMPDAFARLLSKCQKCFPIYSKGEQKINEVLASLSLSFVSEKRFNECRNKNPLPFDFYIEDKLIVEFDGEQHFRAVSFGEKDEKKVLRRLKITQKNDIIKNQYCIDNNIPLLRIPYWEFDNIENILINELINYNIINIKNELSNIEYLKYRVDENWNQKEYLNQHLSLGA